MFSSQISLKQGCRVKRLESANIILQMSHVSMFQVIAVHTILLDFHKPGNNTRNVESFCILGRAISSFVITVRAIYLIIASLGKTMSLCGDRYLPKMPQNFKRFLPWKCLKFPTHGQICTQISPLFKDCYVWHFLNHHSCHHLDLNHSQKTFACNILALSAYLLSGIADSTCS